MTSDRHLRSEPRRKTKGRSDSSETEDDDKEVDRRWVETGGSPYEFTSLGLGATNRSGRNSDVSVPRGSGLRSGPGTGGVDSEEVR